MKKLILIRHAEAAAYPSTRHDFDRPLTASGRQDAAKMASVLLVKGSNLEVVISSPALRAAETAIIFTASLSLYNALQQSEIYEADENTLLQLVNRLDDQFDVIGLVGHNPGLSNLLYLLTGKITTMPTVAWAEIELETEIWAEVSSNTGRLIQYQYP